MKNNKPRDLKQFPSLPSKKYFSYGTASALTLALYLFAGNGSAQAEDNNATNSNTSPKTIQTESDKTNTTTANNVTHKSTKNLNDYIDGTPNEDPDEEEDSGTYEVPILYVTVWLDDQGNIIKDAVEDNKTPASERVPVKIPGYQHFRTSVSDGITKFIYRKVNSSQTANSATSSSPKKDESNSSEVNSSKPTTQKDPEQPTQAEPTKPPTQKDPEQPKKAEPTKPPTQKDPAITNEKQKDDQNIVNDKPSLNVTVWLDDKGNIIKDAVEDDKTSKNQRGVIQISGYKYIKTVTEDGITKHIYKKVELKQEKKTSEVTKVKNNITKRMEDNKEKTSQNQKNSEKELPETGVKEQSFNPALLMLLAGLGLIGIFRNKIKE
ncbi:MULTISPECIES: LPXTG cell wall anchor domain-containing protein [Staphylococcus]|uniref:LPXTG cell wall anchor domain-containing protein n=1 Tax=Staphylococcus TaxID=1279 RepID=UPI0002EEDFBB|nr:MULTISPECIES: LPXTG cell wall anchor domain-containing protein [Staphylococcus]MBC3050048.1 LPXTG cell wall anchor domain-containing protein [Staphylococcus capitis]MBC3070027.1 LPXTG cell wall anchor domain-containing protein [Staphylococcus capitis]MBC3072211.1 LPXTG cell wall anchor domain-containing protein [Staphylococcus capitis]MBC3083075.1 LPXTG cell wall anchor domain-containing protein [Staphylococcus capitis]MBO0371853.1 LPXTG cell wall anchor domain-containing protein [Staphyloc